MKRTEIALIVVLPLAFLAVALGLKSPERPVTNPLGTNTDLQSAKVYVHLLLRGPRGMLSVQVDNHRGAKTWFNGNSRYCPATKHQMTPEEDREFRLNLARVAQSQTRLPGPFHLSLQGKLGEVRIDQIYDKGTTREIEAMLAGPPFSTVIRQVQPLGK